MKRSQILTGLNLLINIGLLLGIWTYAHWQLAVLLTIIFLRTEFFNMEVVKSLKITKEVLQSLRDHFHEIKKKEKGE